MMLPRDEMMLQDDCVNTITQESGQAAKRSVVPRLSCTALVVLSFALHFIPVSPCHPFASLGEWPKFKAEWQIGVQIL